MNKFTKLFGLGVCALGLSVFAQSATADVVSDIVKRGELRVAVQTQARHIQNGDSAVHQRNVLGTYGRQA